MAGNKHRHGKGWPHYGRPPEFKGEPMDYTPRKRGPAQIPKRQPDKLTDNEMDRFVAHGAIYEGDKLIRPATGTLTKDF